MSRRAPRFVMAATLLLLVAAERGWSQENEEVPVLRRAAALEARGRYAEARGVLEDLLRASPESSAALFALERVLRPLGETRAILPWADRYLQGAPGSPGARLLKLRVLAETDSVSALVPEVEAWIAADPGSPEPYREGARVLEEKLGAEHALALLERGRSATGASAGLALETGDVLLRAGEPEAAGRAWSSAVGLDGSGAPDVLRRVAGPGAERRDVVLSLLDGLDREPTSVARRRVGVELAVAAGMEARALELARKVAPELEGTDRKGFLAELGRSGEERGLAELALWAFRALRDDVSSERERRALDRRIASTALQAADTALALEAQLRVARALDPGSPERRRVVADLIRVEAVASTVDSETLLQRLAGFRAEFPDAPEVDLLASAVARGLRSRGRGAVAVDVLEEVSGPRSTLERAYLLFEQGAAEEGREALLEAASGLEPTRATGVIRLASILDRVSPAAVALLTRSAALAHRGDLDGALETLDGGVDALAEEDRPAVLAHAARTAADGGRPSAAAELRRRLLRDHPDAPEAAEATLAFARWRALDPDGVPEAVGLLEELILERPGAAVVPAARRELERLRRVGGGGTS